MPIIGFAVVALQLCVVVHAYRTGRPTRQDRAAPRGRLRDEEKEWAKLAKQTLAAVG